MLGVVPVTIGTTSADKETVVKERVIVYMVKELQSIFLSKDTLVEMRTIPPYFPLPPPLRGATRSHGNLAGLKGTSTDTIAEEECIPPKNSVGAKVECGFPLWTRAPAPQLPFPTTEENKVNYLNVITKLVVC